jgi:foldase protein PrsA
MRDFLMRYQNPCVQLVLVLTLFLPAINGQAQSTADPVVISSSEMEVSRSEFNSDFRIALRMLAADQGIALGNQPEAQIERLRKQYLNQRSAELALVQEAHSRGILVSDEEVIAQAAEYRDKINADTSLDEPLDNARLLELVREKQLVKSLTKELLEEIVVSSGDVLVLYHDANYLRRPEQVCLRQILVEDEPTARDLLTRLENGADFESLARESSTDSNTAAKGGDMGCFARAGNKARSEFEKAAFEAEINELTGPVKSELGYHVLLVYERRPSYAPTLNQAYDEIEQELRHEKLPQKLLEVQGKSGIENFPDRI